MNMTTTKIDGVGSDVEVGRSVAVGSGARPGRMGCLLLQSVTWNSLGTDQEENYAG